MSAKFKYYIGATEVNPLGSWKLKAERKKDYIFYRWEFSGKLKFIKVDYDLIKAFAYGTEIPFTIECNAVGGNAAPFAWNGYFKYPVDFFFDDDKCTCEAEPHVDDIYRCMIENEDIGIFKLHYIGELINIEIYNLARDAKLYTILNSTSLKSFIEIMIEEYKYAIYQVGIDCGNSFNIISSFFWLDDYEDGTSPGANNYVTTVTNKFAPINGYNLFLRRATSVSNYIVGATCNKIEFPKYSFKQFFQWLYDMFQVRWFFDSNNEFRIEHIYFFEKDFPESSFGTNGLDFTTLISFSSKLPYTYSHNKYKYVIQDLVTNEILIIGGSENEDFVGEKIYYNKKYVDALASIEKEKKYNVDIETDIQSIIDNIGDYCEGNLVMFHTKWEDLGAGNEYILQLETGVLSAALQQNGHLSVANLQDKYWKHDRPLINGYLNGTWQTFDSAKRVKKQEKFTVPLCCATEFNPMDYHKSDLGWGQVQEAIISNDGSLEVTLLHESDLIPEEF